MTITLFQSTLQIQEYSKIYRKRPKVISTQLVNLVLFGLQEKNTICLFSFTLR